MPPDIHRTLCTVLTGQPNTIDWAALTPGAWQQFVTAARQHGVAPLVCYRLQETGWPAAVPPAVQKALQQTFYYTTAQNTMIYYELERVLAAFQDIPVIVLKGAALANTLYPHIGTRPMSDIDLLVPRNALRESIQALQRLEYVEYVEPVPEIAPGFNVHKLYEVCLQQQNVNTGSMIELHWQVVGGDTDRRVPPMNWFWNHTEAWFIKPRESHRALAQDTGDAYELTPMANLLYLVAHLILQHGKTQPRLLWYYDLHLLITCYANTLDWTAIQEHAKAFHWDAALAIALKKTQQYFGTALPAYVVHKIAATNTTSLQDIAMREPSDLSRASRFTEDLLNRTWRGRYSFVWGHLFPSRTYLCWRYQPDPPWLWPLYYPYRWYTLAISVCGTLVNKIRAWGNTIICQLF